MSTENINRTTRKLILLSVAMFGFGYLLVPLYNVFCEITGLNGKTGTLTVETANSYQANLNRLVSVEFDTNVHTLPWDFDVKQRKFNVNPGKIAEATFTVKNNSGKAMTGRAIPSVTPSQASIYFKKTECFCFVEQVLQPGESQEVKVRFVVDPELPERFGALTLSYTYFEINTDNKVTRSEINQETNQYN